MFNGLLHKFIYRTALKKQGNCFLHCNRRNYFHRAESQSFISTTGEKRKQYFYERQKANALFLGVTTSKGY